MPASNVAGYNRQMRSGSLSIPASSSTAHQQHLPQMGGPHRFDGPRSPPNTLHVPCKFFRQGACQAGNACPFSHDIGAAQENICKYFAKGNCKFGPKCANIHVLPDGRRINYSKNGVTFGTAPITLGGRPANFHSTSALTNSFMRADAPFNQTYQYSGDDNNYRSLGRQPSLENGIPIIDTTYSQSGSAYGSPRDTDTRLEMGLSPVNKGLSVLDAPLPASFDSNGISNAARYPNGPFPASVPNQFGLDSPSPSLNYAKESRTSETLKLLHNSAFGSSDHLSPSAVPPASSSPPSQYPSSDEIKRAARHSSRYAKPRMLSSSMPKGVDRDWDPEFPFAEEDYVPENLKELLTPTEKARRGSLRCDSEVDIPSNHAVKFGSPIPTASPSSRWWGPRKDDETNGVRYGASPFGHVGSPLRNSVIGSDLNSTAAGTGRPGGVPSRRGTGSNESLSVLTQQLRHTRLDDGSASGGSSPRLRPNGGGRNTGSDRERAPDRHTSSGSISSARLASHPIDEEDENNFVFNMDEEDSLSMDSRATTRKSSGFSNWTYAGVVAGKGTNGTSGIGAAKREPGVIGR